MSNCGKKPRPLREHLRSAVNQRNASLYNDRCHRKDIEALRASIGRAEVFLRSFPVADDRRVCEHVKNNLDDLGRILLSNSKGPLMKVYMGYLKERNEQLSRAA